jgi:hypothetical protein
VVVVVCHAGVIESSMLRFLGVERTRIRLQLRSGHAGMTEWERGDRGWLLIRYNDLTPSERGARTGRP